MVFSGEFSSLVQEYLGDYFRRHPVEAALTGNHEHDGELEDFSASALAEESRRTAEFQQRFDAVEPASLGAGDRADLGMLGHHTRLRQLEFGEIHSWRKNPMLYADTVSVGMICPIIFPHAPLEERLVALRAKALAVPRLMEAALENLDHIPAPFAKVGAESFNGASALLRNDIPSAMAAAPQALRIEIEAILAHAAGSLDATAKELAARCDPEAPFELGIELFQKKLLYQEGIDLPVERILAVGEAELERTQTLIHAAAAQLGGGRRFADVWDEIVRDHPAAGQVAATAQEQVTEVLAFLESHEIVTIPTDQPVIVAPTPEFLRWSFASMWGPGPLEKTAMPAYYWVTEADPGWSPEQIEEHLSSFNHSELWATTVHEAYPGHYVQGAFLNRVDSPVRRFWPLAPLTFVEGWAHYTEEMMVEAGFRGETPRYAIGQLAGSLQRLCRLVVAIGLHCQGWSLERGTRFFMENAYMKELPASREAERGSFDPLYLVYSLGKLLIRKLREDYREDCSRRATPFSLREFHDRLLAQGAAPIATHRELMMPGDSRPIL